MPGYEITKSIFGNLETLEGFKREVQAFYNDLAGATGLKLQFCPFRQEWAHQFYIQDVARLREQLGSPPNHYKRCGALAFWLRREPPVLVWDDREVKFEDLPPAQQYRHDFLLKYGREWGAFNFGYQICLFYECNGPGGPYDKGALDVIDEDYVDDVVEMLKMKSVSLHCLHMIYKSIFMRRRRLGA